MRFIYWVLIGLWLIPLGLLFYGFILISILQLGGVSLGEFLINIGVYGSIVMSIITLTVWLLILRRE
jgi:hypothetical protein